MAVWRSDGRLVRGAGRSLVIDALQLGTKKESVCGVIELGLDQGGLFIVDTVVENVNGCAQSRACGRGVS